MVISRTMKRSSPHASFASQSWTVTLYPEDLGFESGPYAIERGRYIRAYMMYECQVLLCNQMVREGVMAEAEYYQLVEPLKSALSQYEGKVPPPKDG